MPLLKIAGQQECLIPNSCWLLKNNINGYKRVKGNELSTQVIAGRKFKVISDLKGNEYSSAESRIEVQLLEDGYICWLKLNEIIEPIESIFSWKPILLSTEEIALRIPNILHWIEHSSELANEYLWGGTIGPNFDCSGLIQRAFSIQDIWLPRDAYQQEAFSKSINFNRSSLDEIKKGDLLFFGKKRCSHVGIYKGNGDFWHSSGITNGRNGIGLDTLKAGKGNSVSAYYQSILRSAGRIEYCHDGSLIASLG